MPPLLPGLGPDRFRRSTEFFPGGCARERSEAQGRNQDKAECQSGEKGQAMRVCIRDGEGQGLREEGSDGNLGQYLPGQ